MNYQSIIILIFEYVVTVFKKYNFITSVIHFVNTKYVIIHEIIGPSLILY